MYTVILMGELAGGLFRDCFSFCVCDLEQMGRSMMQCVALTEDIVESRDG
jgi:hypothetical protein